MLYVVGGVIEIGVSGDTITNHALVYNPVTNKWRRIANLPYTVWRAVSGVIDGMLYVVGGITGTTNDDIDIDDDGSDTVTNKALVYNPFTGIWKQTTNLITARGFSSSGVICNKLYVVGGETNGDDNPLVKTAEVYY